MPRGRAGPRLGGRTGRRGMGRGRRAGLAAAPRQLMSQSAQGFSAADRADMMANLTGIGEIGSGGVFGGYGNAAPAGFDFYTNPNEWGMPQSPPPFPPGPPGSPWDDPFLPPRGPSYADPNDDFRVGGEFRFDWPDGGWGFGAGFGIPSFQGFGARGFDEGGLASLNDGSWWPYYDDYMSWE